MTETEIQYKKNKYQHKIFTNYVYHDNFVTYLDKYNYYNQMGGECKMSNDELEKKITERVFDRVPTLGKGSFGTVYGYKDCAVKKIIPKSNSENVSEHIDDATNIKLQQCQVLYRIAEKDTIGKKDEDKWYVYENVGPEFGKKGGELSTYFWDDIFIPIYKTITIPHFDVDATLNNINFIIQIAKDLKCVYGQDIVYFDLKSENVVYRSFDTIEEANKDNLKRDIFSYKTADGTLKYAKITIIDIDGFKSKKGPYGSYKFTKNINEPIEIYMNGYTYKPVKDGEVSFPLLTGFTAMLCFFWYTPENTQGGIKDVYGQRRPNYIPENIWDIMQYCLNLDKKSTFDNLIQMLENIRPPELKGPTDTPATSSNTSKPTGPTDTPAISLKTIENIKNLRKFSQLSLD